jgi:hypothetical protein
MIDPAHALDYRATEKLYVLVSVLSLIHLLHRQCCGMYAEEDAFMVMVGSKSNP